MEDFVLVVSFFLDELLMLKNVLVMYLQCLLLGGLKVSGCYGGEFFEFEKYLNIVKSQDYCVFKNIDFGLY